MLRCIKTTYWGPGLTVGDGELVLHGYRLSVWEDELVVWVDSDECVCVWG